jgi:hypothetical protein
MEAAEYDRRRVFVEMIKAMSKPEHIEIARILQKRSVPISENRSGMFFDMAKLPAHVFEELLHFHKFVLQNNSELEKRDVGLRAVVQHVE